MYSRIQLNEKIYSQTDHIMGDGSLLEDTVPTRTTQNTEHSHSTSQTIEKANSFKKYMKTSLLYQRKDVDFQ